MMERFGNKPRLTARAAAVFDESNLGPEPLRHFAGMCSKDREFRPRRVILRQPADLLEEPRAGRVVKVLARQSLVRTAQAAKHVGAKLFRRRAEIGDRSR